MNRALLLAAGLSILGGVRCLTADTGPLVRSADQATTIYLGDPNASDWARPVSLADLDGDGYDDLVIGASKSYGGAMSRVYVIRGGIHANRRGIVDLAAESPDQVIVGAEPDDNLGASIACGDFNGDGTADLVLCASTADYSGIADRGIAYLIFGGPSFFDQPIRDLAQPSAWDLRILGPVAGGDMGGANLLGGLDSHAACLADIDGDNYADAILGVHLADGADTQAGRVYVIFGGPYPSGFTLNLAVSTSYGIRIDGAGRYDELGTIVTAADLTGDGLADLILPCQYYSRGLFTSEGAVYVFRGRSDWPAAIDLSVTPADITLIGARAWDELGSAAVCGDFNGDDIADLAAAAPGAELGAYDDQQGDGLVYGLLGSAAYQSGTHVIDYATATADFVLAGEDDESLGAELAVGDFNHDGLDDLAAVQRFGGADSNGTVDILLGRDFSPGQTFYAGVGTDWRIVGAPGDRIGFSVAAGNVDGQPPDELIYGTPFNNGGRGTVYVATLIRGDIDADADVDLADLALLLASYGACAPEPAYDDFADLNRDGCVDIADLALLLAEYGAGL